MHGILRSLFLIGCAAASMTIAQAQSDQQNENVFTLDSVLVTGEQPGPGLWKVTNGDHTMWILGMQAPLAKDLKWRSARVESLVAQSQEILLAGGIVTDVDIDGGFFDFFKSISAYSHLTQNPNDEKLIDVLPRATYEKWQRLKAKYVGHNSSIERKRPIFAAMELEQAAMKKNGFPDRKIDIVSKTLKRVAKEHHVKAAGPGYKISFHPQAKRSELLKNTSISSQQDLDCFQNTIEGLEDKLALLKARANAWAEGDIERLQALNQTEMGQSCADQFGMAIVAGADGTDQERGAELARIVKQLEVGMTNVRNRWVVEAEAALEKNTITFATLPIYDLVAPEGRLAMLRRKGYAIQTPDQN